MKRDPALASLSRDHHEALVVAQTLSRVTVTTARDARITFLDFWNGHRRAHFRLEEEVLLPAYAAHGDSHHPTVARALCDHVAIRRRANALARDLTPKVPVLRDLGAHLAQHVRFEEHELFPLVEHAMPAAQLAALAVELEGQERDGGHE